MSRVLSVWNALASIQHTCSILEPTEDIVDTDNVKNQLKEALCCIYEPYGSGVLETLVFEIFERVFEEKLKPYFDNVNYGLSNAANQIDLLESFIALFVSVYRFHRKCLSILDIAGSVTTDRRVINLPKTFQIWISYKLEHVITADFELFLMDLARNSFQSVSASIECEYPMQSSIACYSHTKIESHNVSQGFSMLCLYLQSFNFVSPVLQVISSIVFEQLQNFLKAENRFDIRVLPMLREWLDTIVLEWLRQVLGLSNKEEETKHSISPMLEHRSPLQVNNTFEEISVNQSLKHKSHTHLASCDRLYLQWHIRLEYLLCQELAARRIHDMFEIIVDYPDSLPALEDMKECLQKTGQKQELAKQLKMQLMNRLLHAGATTSDILTTYVHTIHSLRIIDPDGMILQHVSEPIRKYLQRRNDTIRCIINGIVNESEDDAFRDLISVTRNISQDEEEALDDKWQPQPADAPPQDENTSEDAFSILLSIYGSKELFLNEYRNALADRILTSLDFHLEKEIRNVELLKLRFGENLLLACDIMLRDFRESKRLLVGVKNETSCQHLRENDVQVIVRSHSAWPEVSKETFQPPVELKCALDEFQEHFERVKTPRKLIWDYSCGVMKLSFKVPETGRSILITVSPLQGSILLLFGRHHRWHLWDLAKELSIDCNVLRQRILPLVHQGLLQELETGECYQMVENLPMNKSKDGSFEEYQDEWLIEEEMEKGVEGKKDPSPSDIWIYERYVYGILESFHKLSLERIHKLLKVFVINPRYDKTEYELNGLLTALYFDNLLVTMTFLVELHCKTDQQCLELLQNKSESLLRLSETFRLRLVSPKERKAVSDVDNSYKEWTNKSEHLPLESNHLENNRRDFSPVRYFQHLQTKYWGHILAYASQLPSTQDVARTFATALNLNNFVVVADTQTKGRGRRSNMWQTERGSLAFSTVCSYTLSKTHSYSSLQPWRSISFIQYLVALTLVEVSDVSLDSAWSCLPLRIKWPNDLYLENQKVGGILCEGSVLREQLTLVIGIGLNIYNSYPTTCLNEYLRKQWSNDSHATCLSSLIRKEDILARFLYHFELAYTTFEKEGFEPFHQRFLNHWLHSGQRLQLYSMKEQREKGYVYVQDLSEQGGIVVKDERGLKIELDPDLSSLDWQHQRAILREK
eukprot:jgi/Galph1/5495/GphlegSOOS_G4183.1